MEFRPRSDAHYPPLFLTRNYPRKFDGFNLSLQDNDGLLMHSFVVVLQTPQ